MKLGLGIGAFGPPGGARIVELAKEAETLATTLFGLRNLRFGLLHAADVDWR